MARTQPDWLRKFLPARALESSAGAIRNTSPVQLAANRHDLPMTYARPVRIPV